MSHVATINIRIRSLAALAKACKALGLELVLDQKTYRWWGRWVRDYHGGDAAYKNGVRPEDFGKCVHAIRQASNPSRMNYELGLVPQQDGDGFRLIYDFVDFDLTQRLGGQSCQKLVQEYSLAVAEEQCQDLTLQGWTMERVAQPNGDIQLVLTQ